MRTRKTLLACALLLAAVAARAQKIVFTPQWTPQAQFAGYYVAQEMGFFKEAGVDVEIVHPSLTQPAMSRIRNNESQATTLMLCQAVEIIDSGIPLVNILQTSMSSALVIVSRKDQSPLTQKGIRVGTWSAGFDQLAISLSIKENLDYQFIRFATGINLFLSGAIDATLAMSYNELNQLRQAGVILTENNVYRFCDHGYNVQEDGVYMTREYYEAHKAEAKAFAQACRRGWEWAAEHPEETLDIVMKYVRDNHIETNRILQRLMLEDILRLQLDKDTGERAFTLRPDMVNLINQLMIDNQVIFTPVHYEDLIPND
ncbi:MAG: ABC transporter substrate-binding protein [Bacteroidales bacterium]|nr:ABC transporter substrate-binding protein [Bacteroidales bacterium]